jgi:REP element-mobilizing transposase RayT
VKIAAVRETRTAFAHDLLFYIKQKSNSMYERFNGLYFSTASINKWYPLFNRKSNIKIVLTALSYLVKNNRCSIYAFVIMPNHIHLIWQIYDPYTISQIAHSLFSYTAKIFLNSMKEETKTIFKVSQRNKQYQIWQKDSWSFEILYQNVLEQKMNYVHMNATRANLVDKEEDYPWSSYNSYLQNKSEFEFLTLW